MGGVLESKSFQMTEKMDAFSIEVIERFLEPNENDSHWIAAVKFAKYIGYDFLTIGAVSKYNVAPLWVRTTLTQDWVNIYLEKNYFSYDPMIAHMQSFNTHIVLDADAPTPKNVDDPKLLEFIEDARRFGFGRFRGIPFNWPTQTVYRIVTFGMYASSKKEETPDMVAMAQILAEVLATRIPAPSTSIGQGVMWPRKTVLTDRERELLYFLAIGLKNDRIAERCGLAEVTVRKHLLSARQKLGASTREQALAIALQDGLINL